jgi:pimeloyl-ACP methyl ester carboxylesterase
MRGYGATEAPDDFASYNAYTLAADALGLLQRLGIGRAALVGRDHQA